jgi:hypothetical protein
MGLIGVPEEGVRSERTFFKLGLNGFGGEGAEGDAVLVVEPVFGVAEGRGGRGSFHWMVAGVEA